MDRLDLFRIFLRVVECASFTRAAASLDLPRSSVSAAIQTLEQRVGTRLLARTTRRVAPTREGEAFFARCQQLIADIKEAEAPFRRGNAALSGTIKVNLPGRIGRLPWPRHCRGFSIAIPPSASNLASPTAPSI